MTRADFPQRGADLTRKNKEITMRTESQADAAEVNEMPPEAREFVAKAMRRANTFLQAPRVCERRACRRSGECHLKYGEDLSFDCGAGLSVLGHEIGMLALRHLLDFVTPILPGMDNAVRFSDLWLEHHPLIEEKLKAERKAKKRLYDPPR
jgi:hypothetical protein